jgi:hypothetical protein
MDDVPQIDYREEIRIKLQTLAIKAMPDELRPLYKIYPDHFQHYFFYSGHGLGSVKVVGPDSEEKKLRSDTGYIELCEATEKQRERMAALKGKVYGLIHSVQTAEALDKIAPEFSKYIATARDNPIDRSVPAVANVVADLVKAGWPKE